MHRLYRWAFGGVIALGACSRTISKPPPSEIGEPVPTGPTGPAGGDGGSGCGLPGAPAVFSLPTLVGVPIGSFKGASGSATCSGGRPFHYSLRDMDGDQQPDLVVDSACDDTTIGVAAWNIYLNTGAGFAPTPTRFALPQPALDYTCLTTTVVDANGDLKPDLVVLKHCTDASVGTDHWTVYPSDGTGFAAATRFPLPSPAIPGAFTSLGRDTTDCTASGGLPAFGFFDVDGDRRRDIVVTSACDDATIGTAAWRVYLGSGAGVTPAPTKFPLPSMPAPSPGAWNLPGGRAAPDCAASSTAAAYDVVDFNGDYKPDLLVSASCNDTTVGATRWLLYTNGGTGFAATPTPVALPVVAGAPLGSYATPSADAGCASSKPGYSLLDVTGDLRLDLLVTRACADPASGVSHWLLYKNDVTTELSTTAASFALPVALGGTVSDPLGLGSAPSCGAGTTTRPGFFVATLVGLKLGFVETTSCTDTTVGTSRWLLYQAACP